MATQEAHTLKSVIPPPPPPPGTPSRRTLVCVARATPALSCVMEENKKAGSQCIHINPTVNTC